MASNDQPNGDPRRERDGPDQGKPAEPPATTLQNKITQARERFIKTPTRIFKETSEELKKKELEIGGIAGRLIGDLHHAPTRIAFWVIVLSFAVLFVSMIVSDPDDKIVSAAISFISAAIGFIFGQRRSSR